MRVTIELNEVQASVVQMACDLFSRVLAGQIEEVVSVFNRYRPDPENTPPGRHAELRRFVASIKEELAGLGVDSSYGIHADAVHDHARVSYDILRVIRHEVAVAKSKGKRGITVEFDDVDYPFSNTHRLPRCVVETE